ncbi:MAG TPA: MEDS domain-containing protein, partial [Streptosporangiaceae bacterium]|nr:MEDS domain-containing protein [Streptosporangiaceae bacterium]
MTISADTQITDLTVDDHACLTFGEPEELFDLTAAFVRDGLDGGLKVMWLSAATPDRATAELARRGIAVEPALATGQLAAVGFDGRLLAGQVFSADQALAWLAGEMQASGDQGLRLAVDMSWALGPVTGVEQLP